MAYLFRGFPRRPLGFVGAKFKDILTNTIFILSDCIEQPTHEKRHQLDVLAERTDGRKPSVACPAADAV